MSIEPLELTWRRTLRIWWSFCWRGLLLGGLIGGLLGFVSGISILVFKLPWDPQFVGSLLGNLATIPISIVIFRWVLQIRYKDFSIRLIPNDAIVSRNETIEADFEISGVETHNG